MPILFEKILIKYDCKTLEFIIIETDLEDKLFLNDNNENNNNNYNNQFKKYININIISCIKPNKVRNI